MKLKLYRENGSLNSPPIFDAVEHGLKKLGHVIVDSNEDIPVIWSVLWHGRMAKNKFIYENCKKQHRPVLIVEVGNLLRNRTWRICFDHINNSGIFADQGVLDPFRAEKLGVRLEAIKSHRKAEILIATQMPQSLQWHGMPNMEAWIQSMISQTRKYSDRKIIVRPHPRARFHLQDSTVNIQIPKKTAASYDDFDIDYNYHCVINHNSGPAVQAAINGVPVVCDETSLAYEISGQLCQIENIHLPDRTRWFSRLCHTEWTVEEIKAGIPFQRLFEKVDIV